MSSFTLHVCDALDQLRVLPADSVQTCVTSPPYWGLRDYGVEGQIGLEASSAYAAMAERRSKGVTPSLFLAAGGSP